MEKRKLKGLLEKIEAIVDVMAKGTNGILLLAMLMMSFLLGTNIVLRYFFGKPITWSNMVSRYIYIYIVLLGTAISYIEGTHAVIDFAYMKAPKKLKNSYDFFHYIIMIVLCVLLLKYGMKQVIGNWHVKSPVLTWLPMGFVYLSIPLSALVMVVFLMRELIVLLTMEKR